MAQPTSGVPRTPSSAVARRIIVTACPHAGGQRVRAALATHPGVHDLATTPVLEGLGRALGSGHAPAPPETGKRGGSIGVLRRTSRWVRVQPRLRGRVAELDRRALAAGSRNWVAQAIGTGAGLRALERTLPAVRVVHVVRDGRDVVAAHCAEAAARRGRCTYGDAMRAVAQWNRAMACYARALERPGHVFVLFEDWAGEPENTSRRIARAFGLPREAPHVIDLGGHVPVPPVRAERRYLRDSFDRRTRRRIEAALDLERYGRLAERVRQRCVVERKEGVHWTPSRVNR